MLDTYNKTRFESSDGQRLYFKRFTHANGPANWRIIHYDPAMGQNSKFAAVGSNYKSKDELLADLERFGASFGF